MSRPAPVKGAAAEGPPRAKEARLAPAAVRRGLVAGLLAWVFPGAGHFYLGARRRAYVFCGLLLLTLGLGLANAGNLAVYDPRTPWISRAKVLANLAIGPYEPLLRAALYGAPAYAAREPHEPQGAALTARRERSFRPYSGYGSAYLMAVGLMNLLLIFDAWDIGIGRKR